MIRLVICAFALTLAVAFATTAAAQSAVPALRANVTVTGDVVRIGDLIENAGPAADVPIFRAPDLGTRGVVAADRVIEAAESHQLIGIDTRGLSEVVVARASRAITAQEISARIAQALEGQYGFGEARNILITFDRSVHTLNVERGASGELQVLTLAYDTRTARFDATLDLPSSAALRRQSTHFFGTAVETINAVTIERPLERGEVIKASDLAIQRRPKAEGAGNHRDRCRGRNGRPPSAAPRPGLVRGRPDEADDRAAQRYGEHHLRSAWADADAARPGAGRRRARRHDRRPQCAIEARRAGHHHRSRPGADPRHRRRASSKTRRSSGRSRSPPASPRRIRSKSSVGSTTE